MKHFLSKLLVVFSAFLFSAISQARSVKWILTVQSNDNMTASVYDGYKASIAEGAAWAITTKLTPGWLASGYQEAIAADGTYYTKFTRLIDFYHEIILCHLLGNIEKFPNKKFVHYQ